jgi:hypothetical protein
MPKRITRRRALVTVAAASLPLPAAARVPGVRGLGRGTGGGGGGGGAGPFSNHGSPMPIPYYRHDYVFYTGTTGFAAILTGTTTIDADFTANFDPLVVNTMVGQWWVDGVPASPYITGPADTNRLRPNFPWTLNSATLSNGTHHIQLRIVDTSFNSFGSAYDILCMPGIFLVQNPAGTAVGDYSGSQVVPTGSVPTYAFAAATSQLPDFATYPGTVPAVNAYPRPAFSKAPSSDIQYRNYVNLYFEDISANKAATEFFQTPMWATTLQGGVYIDYNIADIGKNFVDDAYPIAFRSPTRAGGRCQALTTPFSTWISLPGDDTGYYGVTLQGGFFHLAWNGTVTLLAGLSWNPAKLAFDPYYATFLPVDEATILAQMTILGTHTGIDDDDLSGLNDLAADPRDTGNKTFYLVSYIYNYILKVDLNFSPPHITQYAGQIDVSGYGNGTAAAALFHSPASIVCCDGTVSGYPAGTLLVADYVNSAIRRVNAAGTIVDTLVGNQTSKPTDAQLGNPAISDTWSPPGSVGFTPGNDSTGAYINRPFEIRFASNKSKLVVLELFTSTLRVIDLAANTVTRIPNSKGAWLPANYSGWTWFSIDTTPVLGPQDDIAFATGFSDGQSGAPGAAYGRISLNGSFLSGWIGDSAAYINEGPGPSGAPFAPLPIYAWIAEFSKTRSHFLGGGTRWWGIEAARARDASDPPVDVSTNTGFNPSVFSKAHTNASGGLWDNGTCMCFPINSRPSFSGLFGSFGEGLLGSSVAPIYNDMAATYPTDGSFTAEICAPGTLGRFFQDGCPSANHVGVPRPELTGNDLRALCYFIRREALTGTYPTTVDPGPLNTDTTFPIIDHVLAVRLSSTSIQVTWTTDKRTIGCAVAGSAFQQTTGAKYNVFSPIETSFGTSHTCTIAGLPLVTPIHYAVISKDVAGNSVYSDDLTIS